MDRRTAIEAELTATRERIAAMTGDLDALAAASAGSNLDDEHDPEGATVAFEREQAAALRTRAEHQLAELEAALRRLDDGRYGECEQCARPIGSERLDALPAARTCVSCAARTSAGRR
jgi:RNA polymerase-binding transcription factor DksA